MFNLYTRYLINKFLLKFFYITLIFFALTLILGILEEISFFKDLKVSFFYSFFLNILNAPITLFEIFPFMFLLTTQFVFLELFRRDELNLLKINGLSNFKIIKIFFFLSFVIGIFNVAFYYNFASILKFHYSNIKNSFSNDNKYLAMYTKSGLWIKDEVDGKILIVKSELIKNNYLSNTIINEFNPEFELIKTIQSDRIDIKNNQWIIYNPIITKENISKKYNDKITLKTNFNEFKITNLFSDMSSHNIFDLFELKRDYEKLGYSSDDVTIHLYKIFTTPIFYSILTLLTSILMFNIDKNRSIIFFIILGILLSVIVYYVNFIFNSLGNSGRLPNHIAIFFPLFVLFIFSIIGLVRINEK